MPNDQMTDSLRKLCYLHVQPLNQVSYVYLKICAIVWCLCGFKVIIMRLCVPPSW